MKKIHHLVNQLPIEQLKWLKTYISLFNKSFMLETLERKAFYQGYLELVVLLNTTKFETYFLNKDDQSLFFEENKIIIT